MTPHAHSHSFLVPLKKCPETLLVLMSAFIGNVTEQNCAVAHLLSLMESFFQELNHPVRIRELSPNENVAIVAAISVKRNNSGFDLGQVFKVKSVSVI